MGFILCFCSVVLFVGCSDSGEGSKWPTNPIESAIIVDARNIWITTDKAELIYLKNGAIAAKQLEDDVAAADFINKDVGWSLMKNGDLFQTHNGGANWQKIGKVQRNIKGKWPFWTPSRMMRFADENVGWIVASDSVFRTEDGGQTWKTFDAPKRDSPQGIVVVDRNEFWYITVTGLVFHTLDGGVTWQSNELPGRRPDYGYDTTIARDAGGRIWVTALEQKPMLYVSSERGQTWDERTFPAEAGKISVESIQFAPDGTGRIVFRRIVETDQPIHSSVAVTTDSGETWKLLPINGLLFEPLRVEFVNASVGFLVGKSNIAMTEDGGTNWKVIYTSKEGPA